MLDRSSTPLRDSRKRVGLSQGELARRLGVDTSLISRWERATANPRLNNCWILRAPSA